MQVDNRLAMGHDPWNAANAGQRQIQQDQARFAVNLGQEQGGLCLFGQRQRRDATL
ncbi:hypothetical protein D3C84_1268550 [compost metagenome]